MKKLVSKSLLFLFAGLAISCGGEDIDDSEQYYNSQLTVANISYTQLVGHWVLGVMVANEAVDLNEDGIKNTNLLKETSCFDPMYITFKEDMTFSSLNARMDFVAGENKDEFNCMGSRVDTGTWTIEGNTLTLKYSYNGSVIDHTKILEFDNNRFGFEITKMESEQYVNDPGDTMVSGITIVSVEYVRS